MVVIEGTSGVEVGAIDGIGEGEACSAQPPESNDMQTIKVMKIPIRFMVE
ncbi:MAG: hypothetical protein V3V23_00275 [Dehalococcoidales bacterium]